MEGQITKWPNNFKGAMCYLSLHLQLLIAPLVSFGHCVICPSIYSFWLPLWYLLVIMLSVPPFTASDCPFEIFWSLCYPTFTASDCPFEILWSVCYLSLQLQLLIAPLISFGHCVICPSIYSFWLPLWYLLVIVLSVPPFPASDCQWPNDIKGAIRSCKWRDR
jgi:hypothetical protein